MSDSALFQGFPKIPRLVNEEMVVTEKIDGTNAQVLVEPDGDVWAGSRNRWLTPESDNFGFAGWVRDHKDQLRGLGVGRHFGEWWGLGIQRRYGVSDKRFWLFREREMRPECVGVVPEIYRGPAGDAKVADILAGLKKDGSRAVPGWMQPEGIVVHYLLSNARWKRLCENECLRKGEVAHA
ncbi:MAG: hypothetical protein H0U59_05245 [Gemmatimonadaceae bacterium]|nr:hypothetical protein [Gemmatimonadaceae bacterium]